MYKLRICIMYTNYFYIHYYNILQYMKIIIRIYTIIFQIFIYSKTIIININK